MHSSLGVPDEIRSLGGKDMSTTLSQKTQTLLKDDHIKEAVQLLIEVDWSERDSNWLALVEVLTQLTDEGTDRDTLLLAKKIHQEMPFQEFQYWSTSLMLQEQDQE